MGSSTSPSFILLLRPHARETHALVSVLKSRNPVTSEPAPDAVELTRRPVHSESLRLETGGPVLRRFPSNVEFGFSGIVFDDLKNGPWKLVLYFGFFG